MSIGKRVTESREGIDVNKAYPLEEAVKLIKERAKAKFDETIEIAMNLGVDPRHADQMVRGVVTLPNGTGRTQRVAVFARGAKADEARAAGAETSRAATAKTIASARMASSLRPCRGGARLAWCRYGRERPRPREKLAQKALRRRWGGGVAGNGNCDSGRGSGDLLTGKRPRSAANLARDFSPACARLPPETTTPPVGAAA